MSFQHSKADLNETNYLTCKYFQPERFWIWLGLTRSESGYFSIWDESKSRISYSNWARGEPDNRLGNEDCVSMLRNTGEWDDLPCDYEPVKTLCEKIIQPPFVPGKVL